MAINNQKFNKSCTFECGKVWEFLYDPQKVRDKGISIIEILVAIFIIVVALTSLLGLITFSFKTSTLTKEINQANSLAQETIEAVRNFRDGTIWNVDGLGVLLVDINYYPKKSGMPPKWQMILGTETIGGFTRKVVFNSVLRDVNDNIVESGGVVDADTKKATVLIGNNEN
jgi:type II secretory pathway pseudopilin PulG